MELPENENPTKNNLNEFEKTEIKNIGDFDMQYFRDIEGSDGWIALGQENCMNQHYFTVYGNKDEKLGIVGIYDTVDEKNLAHPVVDQKYRGRGLAAKFMKLAMDELDLPFITMTISLENIASIRATEKLPGVKKISDEQYEQEFHKVKYIYERPPEILKK